MTFITNITMLASRYCPVVISERYIFMCNIEVSSSVALFRPVRLFKSTNSCTLCGVKLLYTRCREIKECPKEIGVDHNLYVFIVYSLVEPPLPFVMILILKKEHLTLSRSKGSPLTSKVVWR